MFLLIDNYDSFTYNLVDYFARLNYSCRVVRNDEISIVEIEELQPDLIILSPGPEMPEKAGITLSVIQHFHQEIPILGICLGHQAIGQFFGMNLVRAKRPMHGHTSVIYPTQNHPIFTHLPSSFEVMRYHSLLLTYPNEANEGHMIKNNTDSIVQKRQVCKELVVLAETEEGEIMALTHQYFPLVGFQFHPESILTKEGLLLLKNVVNYLLTKK